MANRCAGTCRRRRTREPGAHSHPGGAGRDPDRLHATLSPLSHSDARPGALDTWERAFERADLHPPEYWLLVALGVMLAECL